MTLLDERQICAVCAYLASMPELGMRALGPKGENIVIKNAEQLRWVLIDAGRDHWYFESSMGNLAGWAVTVVNGTALCGPHVGPRSRAMIEPEPHVEDRRFIDGREVWPSRR